MIELLLQELRRAGDKCRSVELTLQRDYPNCEPDRLAEARALIDAVAGRLRPLAEEEARQRPVPIELR